MVTALLHAGRVSNSILFDFVHATVQKLSVVTAPSLHTPEGVGDFHALTSQAPAALQLTNRRRVRSIRQAGLLIVVASTADHS